MRANSVLSADSTIEAMNRVRAPSDATTGNVAAIFVLNSLNIGGSETKVVRLVNALRRNGVLAGIAYLNSSCDLLPAIDRGVPVWHLERRGKFSGAAVANLRRILKEARPSVVFAVNLYPVLYVAIAAIGLRRRPRRIGLLNTTTPVKRDEWRRSFYRPFLRRLDGVVFGCDVQRREWVPYVRPNYAHSTVIYNGVDTGRFSPTREQERVEERRRRGIGVGSFVIGTVGRLAVEKNQRLLIDAVAALRASGIDTHLLIVGDGTERAQLERRAAELHSTEHVTFAGVQSDVKPWLAMMDVFVLPSTNVETFSNAALEAMAMQKTVILSRIGGADEMVRSGIDGYTLSTEELASALVPLLIELHEDPQRRFVIGERARARVQHYFSFEAMVDDYAALISQQSDRR